MQLTGSPHRRHWSSTPRQVREQSVRRAIRSLGGGAPTAGRMSRDRRHPGPTPGGASRSSRLRG